MDLINTFWGSMQNQCFVLSIAVPVYRQVFLECNKVHIRESRQPIEGQGPRDVPILPASQLYLSMFNTHFHVSLSNCSIGVKLYLMIFNECLC